MSQMKAQVDKMLTAVSSGLVPTGMICEQILPTVQHDQYTGKIGKYGTAHLRIENALGGGRGKYRRVETRQYATDSFSIEGHGLEGMVTKQDYKNVEDPFNAEQDETMGLTMSLFLEKEKLLADTLTSLSVLTQNVTLSGTSQFSDSANSNPVAVIQAAQAAILDGCGLEGDVIIMDRKVFNVLKYHPQLLDMLGFKFARPGGLNSAEVAQALGFRKILIADSFYESAKEGQSSSIARCWGKDIVIGVLPEVAGKMTQTLGYQVRLRGSAPRKTYKWAINNPPESSAILVEDEYDMLISNPKCGYLIKDAIA